MYIPWLINFNVNQKDTWDAVRKNLAFKKDGERSILVLHRKIILQIITFWNTVFYPPLRIRKVNAIYMLLYDFHYFYYCDIYCLQKITCSKSVGHCYFNIFLVDFTKTAVRRCSTNVPQTGVFKKFCKIGPETSLPESHLYLQAYTCNFIKK